MKPFLLITLAALCFAASEPRVSRQSILAVEGAINEKFKASSPDPYDLLGAARGTYLEGYGALFTVELQLVYVTPPNPFRPKIPDTEIASIHDRKLKKIPALKGAMRNLIAGAGPILEGLPPNERIAMESLIWTYSWESQQDLPHRIFMSAEKQKLLQAKQSHTDLATVIEEQER